MLYSRAHVTANAIDARVTLLANGLRFTPISRGHGKTFAALLMLRAGAQDSPPKTPSLAHLAEHLALVGENEPLAERLLEEGVYVNASTSKDHVEFRIAGHFDALKPSLQLLGNVLQADPVDRQQLKREIGVLRRELIDSSDETGSVYEARLQAHRSRLCGDPHWRLKRSNEATTLRNRRTLTSPITSARRMT